MRIWKSPCTGFTWGRCSACGSVQKIIDENCFESLSPSYDPGYLSSDALLTADLEKAMGVEEKTRLLRSVLGLKAEGRLLDIGCGMGGFLLAGKRLGLDVEGIDPSASHTRAAVEIFGLKASCGYFDPVGFDSCFNVVVLSHVIEHIYDPRKFLEGVMQVLCPNGRLIVITPNCSALSARVTGRFWSMYKPIDHVTMFTKHTLRASLPVSAIVEQLRTSEWPGEFAAHIISASKTVFKPEISNVAVKQSRVTVRHDTLSVTTRVILAIASFPFYALGRVIDKQSCLYAVIRKAE